MSIHYPKSGKEEFLIASMHRFGKAMEGKRGFVLAQTSRDEDKDILDACEPRKFILNAQSDTLQNKTF